jgi:hypothetical protein
LAATNGTFNPIASPFPFTLNVVGAPNPCSPVLNHAFQPFVGSGSIIQYWGFFMNAHQTVNLTMTYKPIGLFL